MRIPSLLKSSLMALGAVALLAACGGGTEPEPTEAPPEAPEVTAMAACPDEGYCQVRTSSVRCADGFNMFAYRTDTGWCIEQDACARHGGPIICPSL
ncbi:hypothetical protein ACLESD_14040 [Pyxidicoccus sp. 3LFB2]